MDMIFSPVSQSRFTRRADIGSVAKYAETKQHVRNGNPLKNSQGNGSMFQEYDDPQKEKNAEERQWPRGYFWLRGLEERDKKWACSHIVELQTCPPIQS